MKLFFKLIIVAVLGWEAKQVLKKYKPRIVAVTGSVGKTSTKDAIYTVLSSSHFVRKSEKSFNSEIGIPLTILGRPNAWYNPFGWLVTIVEGLALILLKNHYPRWLVLEVGADRPGDIQKIAGWLIPDIVVVTRIPDVPVHVEFFDSPAAVVEEKTYLIRALKKGGTLVLDGDDRHSRLFAGMADGATIVTYGFDERNAVRANNVQPVYRDGFPTGISFRVDYGGTSVPIRLSGALGVQHVYPVLAAVAVGITERLNLVTLGEAFAEHKVPPGRMRILEGIHGSVLIDDSYNSSPAALKEAIEAICNTVASGRRIVVFGDMMELGSYSVTEHTKAGKQIAEVADLLVTVGLRARGAAEGARKAGLKKKQILSFDESRLAAEKIRGLVREGDLVLVKGSQSVRLERVVKALLRKPEQAGGLLVRQDPEWQRK